MGKLGHETMIKEAESYYSTVNKSINGNKFNNELLFNILSMATEKYFVGLLMYKDFMPHNHTITELVEDMIEFYSLDPGISSELLKIDAFLNICAIDVVVQKVPTQTEMDKLFKALKALKEFSDNTIGSPTLAH